jgi:hypothetical protein
MRIRAFAVMGLGLLVHGAGATAADQRPPLKEVSAIRVANYGTPSTVVKDREQVNAIVEELAQLRSKAWRRADAKLSCYATVMLLNGARTVALFRVRPEMVVERVVERPKEKGESSYSIATGETDLPKINTLLAGIPPPKDCK